mgnify:CR=1 FL=1
MNENALYQSREARTSRGRPIIISLYPFLPSNIMASAPYTLFYYIYKMITPKNMHYHSEPRALRTQLYLSKAAMTVDLVPPPTPAPFPPLLRCDAVAGYTTLYVINMLLSRVV